jgi:hypothetical protein
VLVSKQSIHCSNTKPVDVFFRVPLSQGISSLAVDDWTLPQYLEHGELGVTKRAAASGADTTVATTRRAALTRIPAVLS